MNRKQAMQLVQKLIRVLESCETKDQRLVAIAYAERALAHIRDHKLMYMVKDAAFEFNTNKQCQGFILL